MLFLDKSRHTITIVNVSIDWLPDGAQHCPSLQWSRVLQPELEIHREGAPLQRGQHETQVHRHHLQGVHHEQRGARVPAAELRTAHSGERQSW
ncbi:hypothetical protein CEXT_439821 [Caerostris extrusa]|uniref:Uncharacterized protein n=1 Tax=Caerostris extrusa TaxID=172846 RepID=A0AAV4XYG8_CAEEX|nr:hypothetical protein CEXT_439821 [Caerostris extrusa]